MRIVGAFLALASCLFGCSLARQTLGTSGDAGGRDGGALDASVPVDGNMDAIVDPDATIDDAGPDADDVGADVGSDMGTDAYAVDAFVTPDAGCPPYARAGSPAAVSISPASNPHRMGFVRVDFSGFTGTGTDWIELATPCASATDTFMWVNTPAGMTSGHVDILVTSSSGTVEARALFNNSFTVEAISPTSIDLLP